MLGHWYSLQLAHKQQRTILVIDGDRVRRAVSFLVIRHHHWNVERLETLPRQGDAYIPAGNASVDRWRQLINTPCVLNDPRHCLGRAFACRHEDVAFVFSGFVIHHYDGFPVCECS